MDVKKSGIIMYQTEDGKVKIEVAMEEETVWLSQAQMCELFQKSKSTISEHISNVFKEGELEVNSVVRDFRTTAADQKSYDVRHYNLDVIISVGYRVKSHRGTQFRIWATNKTIKNEVKQCQEQKNTTKQTYLKSLHLKYLVRLATLFYRRKKQNKCEGICIMLF